MVRKVQLRDFSLENYHYQGADHSTLYTRPQWPFISEQAFLIYRVAVALYFSCWLIFAIFLTSRIDGWGDAWKFFIYLTNWSFTIETAYLLVSLASAWQANGPSLFARFRERRRQVRLRSFAPQTILNKSASTGERKRTRPLHQIQWLLFNLASAMSLFVVVAFWTLVFPSVGHRMNWLSWLINLHVHFLSGAVMLLEIFLVRMPVRVVHVYQACLMALAYLTFNLVYILLLNGVDLRGHHYTYPVIDWRKAPKRSVIVTLFCLFLVLPVIWFGVVYGCFKVRKWLFRRYWPSASEYDDMWLADSSSTNGGGGAEARPGALAIRSAAVLAQGNVEMEERPTTTRAIRRDNRLPLAVVNPSFLEDVVESTGQEASAAKGDAVVVASGLATSID